MERGAAIQSECLDRAGDEAGAGAGAGDGEPLKRRRRRPVVRLIAPVPYTQITAVIEDCGYDEICLHTRLMRLCNACKTLTKVARDARRGAKTQRRPASQHNDKDELQH